MNRLVIPQPQPGELLVGILGRLSITNGCTSVVNVIDGLRLALGLSPSATTLQVIAAGLNVTTTEVIRRHTTLPALRAVAKGPGVSIEPGSSDGPVRSSNTTQRCKTEALTCVHCAQQDFALDKPSYWRRTHHLPGVDWCPIHEEPLVRFKPSAFESRPADAIRQLKGEACSVPVDCSRASVLGRYAELLTRWLDRDSPYSSAALNRVVQDGCRQHGLRCAQVGKRPVISDLARQRTPPEWLTLYWPEVLSKQPGEYLGRLDGPSKDRHVAYPGATCAFALAVLFESVDDIVVRLDMAHAEVIAARQGSVGSSMLAAQQEFVDGSSISAVCTAHGIPKEQFEPWLREAAKLWSAAHGQSRMSA